MPVINCFDFLSWLSAKLIGLFLQVPAWMKDNDQDEDGRLTYKEFKDSVMEAESLEKQRA